MKACTIGLSVIALGVAALLSAGCDAKGEVAEAAAGGAVGYLVGTAMAVGLGPQLAQVPVFPPWPPGSSGRS